MQSSILGNIPKQIIQSDLPLVLSENSNCQVCEPGVFDLNLHRKLPFAMLSSRAGLLVSLFIFAALKTSASRNVLSRLSANARQDYGASGDSGPRFALSTPAQEREAMEYLPPKRLFEGDIAGVYQTENQLNSKTRLDLISKNAAIAWRWPHGIIPIVVSSAFSPAEIENITAAMGVIQNLTGNDTGHSIRFVEHTDETSYVMVVKGEDYSGCWAHIGNQDLAPGQQQLHLESPGCMHVGTIVHELMHTVGFFHEQSRPDRDDYIEINWRNIPECRYSEFEIRGTDIATTYELPYDYVSITHYEWNAFAYSLSVWTIRSKRNGTAVPGNAAFRSLSDGDALKLNAIYPLCARAVGRPTQNASWVFGNGEERHFPAATCGKLAGITVYPSCTLTAQRSGSGSSQHIAYANGTEAVYVPAGNLCGDNGVLDTTFACACQGYTDPVAPSSPRPQLTSSANVDTSSAWTSATFFFTIWITRNSRFY